jgi:hypothetical protein
MLPLSGEMAEWLKAHAWKACIGETLSRVRIPVSPPFQINNLRKALAPVKKSKRVYSLVQGFQDYFLRFFPFRFSFHQANFDCLREWFAHSGEQNFCPFSDLKKNGAGQVGPSQ